MSWPQNIPNYETWKFKQEEPEWQFEYGNQKRHKPSMIGAWKELEKLSEKEREEIKNIKPFKSDNDE